MTSGRGGKLFAILYVDETHVCVGGVVKAYLYTAATAQGFNWSFIKACE